jgi:hypothetical protein
LGTLASAFAVILGRSSGTRTESKRSGTFMRALY